MLRSLLKRSKTILSWRERLLAPYYRLRTIWPVWFFILNRRARILYKESNPRLSITQQKIVTSLEQTGLAITSLEELFCDKSLEGRLSLHTAQFFSTAKEHSRKEFFVELFEKFPLIDMHNPFVGVLLHRTILDIVNSYLSVCAKLNYFSCTLTRVTPSGSDRIQSQRWHRDPEDRRLCKVFIYLTDVDETSGPFQYIAGSHDRGQWRQTFPQRPPQGSYPPDGAVERLIPSEAVRTCTAKSGSVIFCDTSGLHRGGYATEKERLLFTAVYISSASPWQIRYTPLSPDAFKAFKLDPVQQYLLAPTRIPRQLKEVQAY